MWWERYGKLVWSALAGAALLWAIIWISTGNMNPFSGAVASNKSNSNVGKPCTVPGTTQSGTTQADGTCKA